MDIERFSPHRAPFGSVIIAPLPSTVEMTGFSGSRHYLEQQETVRHGTLGQNLDIPLLDGLNG
ncbi:hypothetical protein [Photobacterium nomapromontoriensis]|uniref:hypothetical protein n=1 Tax=Photobacterium nomapromontoriensis TaxID=2910237 RepID=UPI003D09877B